MRHAGHFDISLALLRELLDLPDGAVIYGLGIPADQPDRLTVYVEHPDLPPVGDGAASPAISPVWGTELDADAQPTGRVDWKILP